MIPKVKTSLKKSKFDMNFFSIFITKGFLIRRAIWREVQKFGLNAEGDVLDFGCGSKPYRRSFRNCNQYIGIDVEVSGHDHTNSKIDVYFNGTDIPFPNERFNVALAIEVFEHVNEPSRALSEIRRVLKPNGLLFLTTPFIYGEHETPYDFQRYTSFGMKNLIEQNDFEIIELRKLNNNLGIVGQLFADNFIYKNRFSRFLITNALSYLLVLPINFIILALSCIKTWESHIYSNLICIARKK